MSDAVTRTRRRWLIGALVAIVALNAGLAVLNRLTRAPSGPASSSYATAPAGVAAYADLVARAGHPVRRLRMAPSARTLAGAGTVVLLDPRDVTPEQARALAAHVRAGGRLVTGGAGPWLEFLLGRRAPRPGAASASLQSAHVVAPAPEVAGVTRVATAGAGVWDRARGWLPVLGAPGRGALLVAGRLGRGRVALLADPSPLQNALLDRADDAALGLALAGPPHATVTFVEFAHGFGRSSGLAALPARWRWALVVLVLAALTWMLSRARRLGPPESLERPLPPPRRAYVDALAGTLARTRRPDEASAPVAAAARARLGARARLPEGATRAEWTEAGAAAGLGDEEVAALLEPATGEDAVLARGRALAQITRGGR